MLHGLQLIVTWLICDNCRVCILSDQNCLSLLTAIPLYMWADHSAAVAYMISELTGNYVLLVIQSNEPVYSYLGQNEHR
jgi:hypothetical protein